MNNRKTHSQNCQRRSNYDGSPIPSMTHHGILLRGEFVEIFNSTFGHMKRTSRMCFRGFTGVQVSGTTSIDSAQLSLVDSSRMVPAGNWRGPDRDLSRSSFECERPLGINFNNLIPTQIEFIKWVNDSYSFIKEGYFGAQKYQVNQSTGSRGPQNSCRVALETLKIRGSNDFDNNNATDQKSYSSKEVTALWAKVLRVVHVAIFPQSAFKIGRAQLT